MTHAAIQRRLPPFLRRHALDFETRIEAAVAGFAAGLPAGARVLDAGPGECRRSGRFARQRYVAVDLAAGGAERDYKGLDAVADLAALPFPSSSFDACLNVATLEHVREPACVLGELARVLKPGGEFLLVIPQDWEVHQAPHDFFRYTRYGARYLLGRAGFAAVHVVPAGGFFRLLSRRLLNALQFFHGAWFFLAALLLAPPALLLPLLDRLDRDRNFTLGYVCTARKRL